MAVSPLAKIAQNSFGGGEVSPAIYGRVELAKFNVALRECYNCFVNVEGGVSNRAGTRVVVEVKDSDLAVRIIPFESSEDNTFVVEVGHEYFRFVFRGAQVVDGMGDPVETVSPYQEEELFQLGYSQTNDIMTITHLNHAPMELRRVANDDWPLSSIDFDPQIAPPANLALVTNTGGGAGETPLEYVVTAILATNGEESLISNILTVTGNDFAAAGDRVAIDWDTVTGAASYNVYKKRGGIFGFIGNVTTDTFIDNNIVPNIGLAPQQANNPFDGSANPRTTFIYQQRRGFGATATKPNTLWLSQTGRLADFKRSVPARADDSIEFALAGKRVQTIRHVLDIEDLALFTHTSEWRVAAGTSGISATAPPFTRPQSDYGSGELPPLLVGSSLLYVQRGGKDVYRFDYSNDFNRYVSENLNILARHLLGRNTSLVDWSYSQVPHSLVYGMRNDGMGVHMTYNREQQIYAWGTNETAGSYEAVLNRVGFSNLAKILRSRRYRLYDPARNGGLWVGRDYGGGRVWRRDPLHAISHGATAMQTARFYYLAVSGRLLEPPLNTELLEILSRPAIEHKFVRGLEEVNPEATIYRKSGTWRQYHADSGIVVTDNYSYILVAIARTPRGEIMLERLIGVAEKTMRRLHGE
jgi:hypothetical protein